MLKPFRKKILKAGMAIAPLPFREEIRREFIRGSAIDEVFLDPLEGTIRFLSDTVIGAGGSCVDEISDALNWKAKQGGFSRREALQGAELFNEDGSTWQVVLSRNVDKLVPGQTPSNKKSKRAPTNNGSKLFLPRVPGAVRRLIGVRYDIDVPLSGSFWDWLAAHPEIPVVITEGGKKALALLSFGYVAIALYGANSGYQAQELPRSLIPELLPFVDGKRRVVLAFDQDFEGSKASKRVAIALNRFGKLLTAQKCKVDVALWESIEGKGIDDAIVKAGAEAEAWLKATIDGALGFEQLRKSEYKTRMLDLVLKLNATQIKPERETAGQYLPELPALSPGQIHLIECAKGGGKSTEIARIIKARGFDRDCVFDALNMLQKAKEDGDPEAMKVAWQVIQALPEGDRDEIARVLNLPNAKKSGFTIVVAPLNSLGQQLAEKSGLPHISSYDKKDPDAVERFWRLARERRGIVMCVDSIGALMDCESLINDVDLVVLDEVNQTLANLALGGTTKSEQARVLESLGVLLTGTIERGGAVLGAEAIIYHRSVEYLKTLCNTEAVRLFSHKRSEFAPWDVELFEGSLSGFVGQLFQALSKGKKIMLMVSSQILAEKLHLYFARAFNQPGLTPLKIIRIDSKTNDRGAFKEFFDKPDDELESEKPDLLICSPSAKSGLSIDRYPFDENWGIFTSLNPDAWAQMTARDRRPVPRKLFIKPFIQPSGSNERAGSVSGVLKRLSLIQTSFANLHGIDLESLIDSKDAARLLEIEQANAAFVAAESTAIGSQKVVARDYFVHLLEADGHKVTHAKSHKDPMLSQALILIHEEIEKEKGLLISDICEGAIDAEGHPVAALRTLQARYAKPDKRDKSADPKLHLPTWIQNLLPLKKSCIEQAPGVDFDDYETCYRNLTKDYGKQWRGVELQSLSENIQAADAAEHDDIEAILTGRLKLSHKLPQKAVKARLIELCGVSSLLDGVDFDNDDPRAIAIKAAALKWSKEIYIWLGLTINENQAERDKSPVAIANKLLRVLGLDAEVIARPASPGKDNRPRIYQVPGLEDPYRNDLLEAMRRRLRVDEDSVKDSLDMLREADGDPDILKVAWQAIEALPECDRHEIRARLKAQERQRAAA